MPHRALTYRRLRLWSFPALATYPGVVSLGAVDGGGAVDVTKPVTIITTTPVDRALSDDNLQVRWASFTREPGVRRW